MATARTRSTRRTATKKVADQGFNLLVRLPTEDGGEKTVGRLRISKAEEERLTEAVETYPGLAGDLEFVQDTLDDIKDVLIEPGDRFEAVLVLTKSGERTRRRTRMRKLSESDD
jgi:hypothetical protein